MKIAIYTDGGSRGNPGNAAIGVVIYEENPEKTVIHEISEYIGVGTNNEAEYKAVIAAFKWLSQFEKNTEYKNITAYLDSKLVVEQLSRRWKIKEPRMQELAQMVWKIIEELPVSPKFIHVPREENKHADALVNQALDAHA